MCGIVGYTGKEQALPFLEEGLKRLEYRGYDSVGVALFGEKLVIKKRAGKVRSLFPWENAPFCTCGVGHTRWATHGRANEKNAHPHRVGNFALVHNGILENYLPLKKSLTQEGVSFVGETDTEVIAALFSRYGKDGLLSAAKSVLPLLRGSYALAVLNEQEPNCIFVAAKGSPLLIGKSAHGYFFASDLPALAPFCGETLALSDGECALLSPSGISCFSDRFCPREKSFQPTNISPEIYEKKGFSCFMEKEIFEIPYAVERTLRKGEISPEILERLKRAERVIFIACGTAYHACLSAKFLLESRLSLPAECWYASEFLSSSPVLNANTLVFAVSQSGETADTLECVRRVLEKKVFLVGLTNTQNSTLARLVTHCLYTFAGVEIGVAATKSYLAQLACLYSLVFHACGDETALRELALLPEKERVLLSTPISYESAAKILSEASGVFFIGRGADHPVALESSLKMKEVTYLFSEGYAAGELKHGTLALMQKDSVVVAFFTQRELFSKMENAVAQVSSRGARVIIVTDEEKYLDKEFCQKNNVADVWLIPRSGIFSPMLCILPVQRLVLSVAKIKGLDPDQPRNLAKSVTVE